MRILMFRTWHNIWLLRVWLSTKTDVSRTKYRARSLRTSLRKFTYAHKKHSVMHKSYRYVTISLARVKTSKEEYII
jgi:hypothetical protein